MRRKLSQIGPSSLMISIPSKWAKKQNLSKGDEIEILEQPQQLILTKVSKASIPRSVSISWENCDISTAGRLFRVAYRTGADEIHITFEPFLQGINNESIPTKTFIMNILEEYIGVELMDIGKTTCRIKEISLVKKEELQTILRRIFFTILNNSNTLLNAFIKNDEASFNDLSTIADRSINRLTEYCNRILGKYQYEYAESSMYFYRILTNFERLGDRIKFIASSLQNSTRQKNFQSILEKFHQLLEITQRAIFTDNILVVSEANKLRFSILNEVNKITTTSVKETNYINHLKEALFICADLMEDRLAISLSHSAQSSSQEHS